MNEDEIYDLPPHEKARALLERARSERREGRDAFAHAYCIQSLNLFRGHRDRPGEAAALLELADLALHYNPTNEDGFSRRKVLGDEALSIYRELGDKRGTASALRVLASIAPHAEALRMLEESLALAREEGNNRGIAASLDRLGAHYAMRQNAKAVALKEEALALYREIGDRGGEAAVLFSLALSFSGTDPARKQECAAEALRIYRELGRKKLVATMLKYLAGDHLDDETNIAYYTECREICREIGVSIWEASSLRRLASIAEKRGDLERAQALRAEADEINPESPMDPELLKVFGEALRERDPDAAKDAAQRLFGGHEKKSRRSKRG